MSEPGKNKELVVLLHGILDSGNNMKPIERYFRRQGYNTLNISYPSTKMPLEQLTEYIHDKLKLAAEFNNASKVHFVTHSLGGLLARYYIHKHRPANLGRVVMAGTPNSGSEFADFLTENPVLRPLFELVCGPVGSQLRVAHSHDPSIRIDYELGVIAGSQSINPLAPFFLPAGHDGTVAIESTRIEGMKDHIVVEANHPFMMTFRAVQKQALHFIRHGVFDHKPG